jgi:hypothetical protein
MELVIGCRELLHGTNLSPALASLSAPGPADCSQVTHTVAPNPITFSFTRSWWLAAVALPATSQGISDRAFEMSYDKRQAREEQHNENDTPERHFIDSTEHQDAERCSGCQRRQADDKIYQDL